MSIVAEIVEHVVGIDTHARTHTYCLVHARSGAVIDTATFPTSKAGNARAIGWIVRRSEGTGGGLGHGVSMFLALGMGVSGELCRGLTERG